MNEPTIDEIRKQYADALRIISEQREKIVLLKQDLLFEKRNVESSRIRIMQLQDQIAGACV